jgi:methylated-DNA-[protein]-cysteine S-methyltransferase
LLPFLLPDGLSAMGLIIDWVEKPDAVLTQIVIPVFEAELLIQYYADVIVRASWHQTAQFISPEPLTDWGRQIQSYLLNSRQPIRLKLLTQGTRYFHRVWHILLTIPLGHVMTYSEVAQRLNSGPRAVARACRENPYAGIIPCHRVVAKSGLGGFMGQREGHGVALKAHILSQERRLIEMR